MRPATAAGAIFKIAKAAPQGKTPIRDDPSTN
jgi:hypothetical protein